MSDDFKKRLGAAIEKREWRAEEIEAKIDARIDAALKAARGEAESEALAPAEAPFFSPTPQPREEPNPVTQPEISGAEIDPEGNVVDTPLDAAPVITRRLGLERRLDDARAEAQAKLIEDLRAIKPETHGEEALRVLLDRLWDCVPGRLSKEEARGIVAEEWEGGGEVFDEVWPVKERCGTWVEASPPKAPPKKAKFHKTDKAGANELPPLTAEEKEKKIAELAALRKVKPLEYADGKAALAKRLGHSQEVVHEMVMAYHRREPKADDDHEQSQATKVMAIGLGGDFRLWHSADGLGFASIVVGDHAENYRIKSSAFEKLLRARYGEKHKGKVGDVWVPQSPGAQALRDGMAGLEAMALHRDEYEPAMRVGRNKEGIWLDLGRDDWLVVKVTKAGWSIVPTADVAFIRTAIMRPLPVPVRGGSVRALQSVMNVRESEFVLLVGWLLQALNKAKKYPLLYVNGLAEMGKSTVSELALRIVDPNSMGLRDMPQSVDDLGIIMKNNWAVGFDNLSGVSGRWSDMFCKIATGIARSKRALYTDDEESTYRIERPVLLNGIPEDFAERSDLASRTIRLNIPPLTKKKTEAQIEREFVAMWPGVLGALLDGLVAALRGSEEVEVEDPARLMDFEQWAEAGCRGMGFREWEFVDAYAANRKGTLLISVDGDPVCRALRKLARARLSIKKEAFVGKMSALYEALEGYKGTVHPRDWPKDATRLSTVLRRVKKPLAVIGIAVELEVDRRQVGGSQSDVVIDWSGWIERKA
jgi:hypothetical protein